MLLLNIVFCCPGTSAEALKAIYAKTNGPEWKKGQDWADPIDVCLLTGVKCESDKIIALDMTDFGITGQLPPEIGCIDNLKSLYLNGNEIKEFPKDICNYARSLQFLQLSNAGVSGSVPQCVCDLTPMQYLYIDNNAFGGEIPACIATMPNLREFVGTCNDFTGPAFPQGTAVGASLERWFASCNRVNCNESSDAVSVVCGASNCDFCSLVCPATLDVQICGKYYFVPRM